VHDARDARALPETLRNEVVPLFYDRDADGRRANGLAA